MKVLVNVKKAGSKRNALSKVEYNISFTSGTLKDVLKFFVEEEVNKYNSKSDNSTLVYFSEKDLEDALSTGKVHFNNIYNDKKADFNKALENTLECFNDGLIRVFINDKEIADLDETVNIHENDIFTFIRLTFLAGRAW